MRASIAGCRPLGLPRIVVLLKGLPGTDSLDLLDLKAPPVAALRKRVSDRQPAWPSQADRVLFALRRLPVLPAPRGASLSDRRRNICSTETGTQRGQI